jgi:hypothetical protein
VVAKSKARAKKKKRTKGPKLVSRQSIALASLSLLLLWVLVVTQHREWGEGEKRRKAEGERS